MPRLQREEIDPAETINPWSRSFLTSSQKYFLRLDELIREHPGVVTLKDLAFSASSSTDATEKSCGPNSAVKKLKQQYENIAARNASASSTPCVSLKGGRSREPIHSKFSSSDSLHRNESVDLQSMSSLNTSSVDTKPSLSLVNQLRMADKIVNARRKNTYDTELENKSHYKLVDNLTKEVLYLTNRFTKEFSSKLDRYVCTLYKHSIYTLYTHYTHYTH